MSLTDQELSEIATSDEGLLNLSDVYNTLPEEGRPTLRTFRKWNAQGNKFVIIAARGSIYILLLIAGLDLCYHVCQMIGHTTWEVAKMLRCPDTAGEFFFIQMNERH